MSGGRGIVYGAVAGAVGPVRQQLRCYLTEKEAADHDR